MNAPRNKKLILLIGCCLFVVGISITIQGTLAVSKRSPRSERFWSEIATLESSLKNAQSESEIESIKEQLELFYQMSTLAATIQSTVLPEDVLIPTQQAQITQGHQTMVACETLSFHSLPYK